MKYTLDELAKHIGATVKGDASHIITGVGTLTNATPQQITFLSNTGYRKYLADTQAGAVILSAKDVEHCKVNALVASNPYVAYARVAALLSSQPRYPAGIDPHAIIDPTARIAASASIAAGAIIEANVQIGEQVRIGPGCVIQQDAVIGAYSVLTANVSVAYGCILGEKNLLHAGAVIGADGFGQALEQGVWIKVPQLGRVVIGNDVEIGANTTIDRGAVEDTLIGDNVKLDNQIQIAHNVQVGAHTAIAGCSAIAGSTKIGKHCRIAGMVGIVGHLEIADNVTVTAMSLVTHSIKEPGVYSSGTPLETNQQWHRNSLRFKQLDDMAKRLKALEKMMKSE